MRQVDVRPIPIKDRHPMIFELLTSLEPGESFELINDHDPKPLYYQIQAERPEKVDWEYFENGPETWRVKVTRK